MLKTKFPPDIISPKLEDPKLFPGVADFINGKKPISAIFKGECETMTYVGAGDDFFVLLEKKAKKTVFIDIMPQGGVLLKKSLDWMKKRGIPVSDIRDEEGSFYFKYRMKDDVEDRELVYKYGADAFNEKMEGELIRWQGFFPITGSLYKPEQSLDFLKSIPSDAFIQPLGEVINFPQLLGLRQDPTTEVNSPIFMIEHRLPDAQLLKALKLEKDIGKFKSLTFEKGALEIELSEETQEKDKKNIFVKTVNNALNIFRKKKPSQQETELQEVINRINQIRNEITDNISTFGEAEQRYIHDKINSNPVLRDNYGLGKKTDTTPKPL